MPPSFPSINGLDEMRVMIYSAGWQMLEERVDTGWTSGFTADKVYQTIYGLRYIDDVICRRLDHDADASYADKGTETRYHLTDNQFSTVAVVDTTAKLLERVSYDPYGRARHHWMADVDGDGDQDSGDISAINTLAGGGGTAITSGSYNVECDIDRDGDIDSTDYTTANTDGTRTALSSGMLSSVGNVMGFSGYVFNAEVGVGAASIGWGGGMYTIRFRHYDTGLGRWLERDPLEYVDGMSMYGYVSGMPLRAMDPFGLTSDDALGQAWDEVTGGLKSWFWGGSSGTGLSRLPQIESAGGLNPIVPDDPLSQMYQTQAEAEAWAAQAVRDLAAMYAEVGVNIILVAISGPAGRIIGYGLYRAGGWMLVRALAIARETERLVITIGWLSAKGVQLVFRGGAWFIRTASGALIRVVIDAGARGWMIIDSLGGKAGAVYLLLLSHWRLQIALGMVLYTYEKYALGKDGQRAPDSWDYLIDDMFPFVGVGIGWASMLDKVCEEQFPDSE